MNLLSLQFHLIFFLLSPYFLMMVDFVGGYDCVHDHDCDRDDDDCDYVVDVF